MTEKLPLQELIRQINKKYKADVITRAADADNSYVLRRPCGIFSIDLATGGGLPAGTMVEIAGPEGAGKNLLADLYIKQQQKLYGDEFKCFVLSTEYKYDKLRAKQNGVRIALSDEEIKELEAATGEKLSEEEIAGYKDEVGEFYLLEQQPVEMLLDAALALLGNGDFQIGVIDSIAMLIPEEEQDKDMDESDRMAARASLQTRFMKKLHRAFKDSKTLLLGLNQVRAPIGHVGKFIPQYKISEAWAVRHGIAGRIEISSGKRITNKEQIQLGKELRWHISKGKVGFHEGPHGILQFTYADGIDLLDDFVNELAPYCARAGAWYELSLGVDEPIKFQGKDAIAKVMREDTELVERLKGLIYKDKDISYLHKETHEIVEEASGDRGKKDSKRRGRKTDA